MCRTREFKVKTVSLAGKNLIEASAGTGKTYSIAILVLRLIIEKRIPVEKILMVTFTKAATAELESRIRKFVRQAYKYTVTGEAGNQTIREVVDAAGKENAGPELRKAVQSLDQLSVMTIHSFCEQSLVSYPFETGQSFKFDIATDISEIRDRVENDYWRRKITTLDPDLYNHFTEVLTRSMIREVLNKAMDGKEYLCEGVDEPVILSRIRESIKNTETSWHTFTAHIRSNFKNITGRKFANSDVTKFLEKASASPAVFIKAYADGAKKGLKYIQNLFPDEFALCSPYLDYKNQLDNLTGQYVYHFFKSAIDELTGKVAAGKESRNVIDFSDQINQLHEAVERGLVNPLLSAKYDAVFIDEFQDTDQYQYRIFSRLFADKIIFYIGDPKQSIYGWRKADLETYLRARAEVDTIQTMNLNFRSTAELIRALNNFFSVNNPFADNAIVYNRVDPGLQELGSMTENGMEVTPFDIYGIANKATIEKFVVNEVYRLLTDKNIKINGASVQPSDIAIIVRTRQEGRSFKKALSGAGIPAITIDETKVMSSDEAGIIRNLMEAVIQPERGAINRVLLNPCFGLTSEVIEVLEDENHLEQFRELRRIWNDSGIYNMLFRFFDLYQVRQFSLKMSIEGQRILTNFYQLAEILHQAELKYKYTPNELLVWSRRAQNEESDEYEQRVESQDDAVQVSTIHKCKGLTYKIVFAPFLDLKVKKFPIYEFRQGGQYKFTHQPSGEQLNLWKEQNEQENRRLIYVALTRAQYKVYVCSNKWREFNDSSLKKFPLTGQKDWQPDDNVVLPDYQDTIEAPVQFSPRPTPDIEIKNPFGIHSFSALSKAHFSAPFERLDPGEAGEYDRFIFQGLGRGANVGTALHSIFERLDFAAPESWNKTLEEASKYYSKVINVEKLELFRQLVINVMQVELPGESDKFPLQTVPNDRKLPELEFCFSLNKADKTAIDRILGDEADLGGESAIDGLMTGFIDLFFEHEGKYYILDWKSNHLGNTPEAYNRAGVEEAMRANNYHLQYFIYTVAMKRFLEKKLPGFDYEKHFGGVFYLFLRGIRKEDNSTGIFYAKPAYDKVEALDRLFRE